MENKSIRTLVLGLLLGTAIGTFLPLKRTPKKEPKDMYTLDLPEEMIATDRNDRLICDSVVNGKIYLSFDLGTYYLTPKDSHILFSDCFRDSIGAFTHDDCVGIAIGNDLD